MFNAGISTTVGIFRLQLDMSQLMKQVTHFDFLALQQNAVDENMTMSRKYQRNNDWKPAAGIKIKGVFLGNSHFIGFVPPMSIIF